VKPDKPLPWTGWKVISVVAIARPGEADHRVRDRCDAMLQASAARYHYRQIDWRTVTYVTQDRRFTQASVTLVTPTLLTVWDRRWRYT